MSGKGTLVEIETHWSLLDVLDAHEALDYKQRVDKFLNGRKGTA